MHPEQIENAGQFSHDTFKQKCIQIWICILKKQSAIHTLHRYKLKKQYHKSIFTAILCIYVGRKFKGDIKKLETCTL